jgi:Asp-tRNA(Asn)/Glu-tRNA(Gln) amidotransferase A subunit family amidase
LQNIKVDETQPRHTGSRKPMSHSVVELDKRYNDRTLTPTQAVEECLESIQELDPVLGAWQEVYAEEARAAARIADAEVSSGRRKSPFHGVPFALKDIVEVEGKRTTAGCFEWQDRESTVTAEVATRLIDAGNSSR